MPKLIVKGATIGLIIAGAVSTTSLALAQEGTTINTNNSVDVSTLGSMYKPIEYTIDTITISGVKYLDAELVKSISGLEVGQQVRFPDDQSIAKAIRVLWNQSLFSDVAITVTRVVGKNVSLNIALKERPRLGDFKFYGIPNSQQTELKEKLNLVINKMVTESMTKDIEVRVKTYFEEKGFPNTSVKIGVVKLAGAADAARLDIFINKGKKVHINNVNIVGNKSVNDLKLERTLKGTKEMARLSLYPADDYTVYTKPERSFANYAKSFGFLSYSKTMDALSPYFRPTFLSASKFNEKKFEEDKQQLVSFYNTQGFRDAQLVSDTIYTVKNGNLNVDIKVEEGKKYYFGDIEWKGNTKYSDSILSALIGIKKGDIYNRSLLEGRLQGAASSEGGEDVGTIYMDQGYLGFQAVPSEKNIVGDTINYQINIQEGPQFTIKNINILGNNRTNDYVLRREMFMYPGDKFNRSRLISSVRMISNLGFIDPEKVDPVPVPNYQDKTVDINLKVAEKSADQLELSAGYGGGIGFTGTAGIVFNNFSIKNLFNVKSWDPLPMGDGQKLSLRHQSSGRWYNSTNLSFTEPWLGGKKPIGLTINLNNTRYAPYPGRNNITGKVLGTPNDNFINNFGTGATISRRLRWPDNNFILSFGAEYSFYKIKDYSLLTSMPEFRNGTSNVLNFKLSISRSSIDQQLYPRSGSNINFTATFTPPFSMFSDKNYADATPREKYQWIEYHKYKFTSEFYQKIAGDFVLKIGAKYGFLGFYNREIGFSPFERYQVGGDGLSGFNYFIGREIIAQRGYEIYGQEFTIFNKYVAEVRYPFSLNPSATIYGLAFFEAANGYTSLKTYNPFSLYRSVGVGLRVFLPMFGLLGLDYGIGLDRMYDATGNKVGLGQSARFTFMLGQEPQ